MNEKNCSSMIDYTCIKFTNKYDKYFYIASLDLMFIDETSSSSSSSSSTSHPTEQGIKELYDRFNSNQITGQDLSRQLSFFVANEK